MAIERGRNMRAIAAWVEVDTGERAPEFGGKRWVVFIAVRLRPTSPGSAVLAAGESGNVRPGLSLSYCII
jgi:hypothetical protein